MPNGTMQVVPPNAAEMVPDSKSSALPAPPQTGWSRWQWASMPPGMTQRPPASSNDLAGQAIADSGDAAVVDADVAFGPIVVERNASAFDHQLMHWFCRPLRGRSFSRRRP